MFARRAGWVAPGLLVVLYHRVVPLSEVGALDPELVDATPEDFDQQMAYLRRHYRPVSVEDVLEARRSGRELLPGSVLVTFDDGYLDNFEYALPALERYGIQGLFFISTGHLSERTLFWWERLSLMVRRSTRDKVHIAYPAAEDLDLAGPEAKAQVVRRLNRIVKDHFALDLERFYAELGEALGVTWDPSEEHRLADAVLMRWDHVRALRRAGMGIGSHTRAHRVLQTLPHAVLADELSASRAKLELELGEPITTIAYPVGKPVAHIAPVRRAVAKAGYELGFTTRAGLNCFSKATDPLDLGRLSIDRQIPGALKRTWMALPFLAP
jgi:peptidoglycan/xylan/chitin deacetylase (PgdA/CDA1 family)